MTKIERINPRLTGLAAQLGGSIYYRGKSWWLSPWDRQLTYERRTGVDHKLSLVEQGALAEEILSFALAARLQPRWGTPCERAARVIRGLRTDTAPQYMPRHFCHWYDASFDGGCIFRTPLHGTLTATLELAGEDRLEAELPRPASWDAVIDVLAQKASQRYGALPPWPCGQECLMCGGDQYLQPCDRCGDARLLAESNAPAEIKSP